MPTFTILTTAMMAVVMGQVQIDDETSLLQVASSKSMALSSSASVSEDTAAQPQEINAQIQSIQSMQQQLSGALASLQGSGQGMPGMGAGAYGATANGATAYGMGALPGNGALQQQQMRMLEAAQQRTNFNVPQGMSLYSAAPTLEQPVYPAPIYAPVLPQSMPTAPYNQQMAQQDYPQRAMQQMAQQAMQGLPQMAAMNNQPQMIGGPQAQMAMNNQPQMAMQQMAPMQGLAYNNPVQLASSQPAAAVAIPIAAPVAPKKDVPAPLGSLEAATKQAGDPKAASATAKANPLDPPAVVAQMLEAFNKGQFQGAACKDNAAKFFTTDAVIDYRGPTGDKEVFKQYPPGPDGVCEYFVKTAAYGTHDVTPGISMYNKADKVVHILDYVPGFAGKGAKKASGRVQQFNVMRFDPERTKIAGLDALWDRPSLFDELKFDGNVEQAKLPQMDLVVEVFKAYGAGVFKGDRCKQNVAKFYTTDAVFDNQQQGEKDEFYKKYSGHNGVCEYYNKASQGIMKKLNASMYARGDDVVMVLKFIPGMTKQARASLLQIQAARATGKGDDEDDEEPEEPPEPVLEFEVVRFTQDRTRLLSVDVVLDKHTVETSNEEVNNNPDLSGMNMKQLDHFFKHGGQRVFVGKGFRQIQAMFEPGGGGGGDDGPWDGYSLLSVNSSMQRNTGNSGQQFKLETFNCGRMTGSIKPSQYRKMMGKPAWNAYEFSHRMDKGCLSLATPLDNAANSLNMVTLPGCSISLFEAQACSGEGHTVLPASEKASWIRGADLPSLGVKLDKKQSIGSVHCACK